MEIHTTITALRTARARYQDVGLVPTMGYLHDGHLSLVRKARAQSEAVVVSIFVNPTQFAPTDDLATYPRDLEHDIGLLQAEGVDLVFAPQPDVIYPPGFNTYVLVGDVTETLEGAARPGFFRGVATVVCKLFQIVQPTRAYFGQKDAQQAVVVRKLVTDLNIPVEIVVCPIVREPDGLALSSRNTYLTPEERASAPILYQALTAARTAYQQGELNGDALRQTMQQMLANEALAQPTYVSVAHPQTLRELAEVDPAQGALLSLAVQIGRARLIDNIFLPPGGVGGIEGRGKL